MNLVVAVLLGVAQGDLTVLKPEEQPRKMLYTFLQAECGKLFEARRKAVAALKTPEDVRKRQADLRAKFIDALGGFPEKTPLNARVVGGFSRDGYRVEKVLYESRPGHHVTAVLYLPDGKPPFPGVLVPCGHSENGKAAETYQRACILLAKNGCAVLCYDPIGQGERKQYLPAEGKPLGSTTEHTQVGIGALLVGTSAATYRIWDGIRSMDYLAGRPEVDPKRLGCTGNSGGGTLTSYLMALDDRIWAAAPSCYITSLERLFATIGPQDAEQNITGQVAFGLEHADYVTLRAPRPTLICIGTQDYFDGQGAWTTFREAKQVYGILGHGERVDLFEFNDKHGFWKPRREAAMRWMRRWLLGADDAPSDPEYPVEKDADLQCTKTGQVLSDLRGKSAFDLNAERERELAANRGKLPKDELLREVRRLIALEASPSCEETVDARVARSGAAVWMLRLRREPGIVLPALRIENVRRVSGDTLYVTDRGMAADAGQDGPLSRHLREGARFLAVDLRGMGETAPAGRRDSPFGADGQEAWLGIHLNRPLLGQRTGDLLAARGKIASDAVRLWAVGGAVPAACHAAALDPSFKEVTLEGGLVSWSSAVKTPLTRNQLSNVVPGALQVYDLPDLAAAIAPRPLTIRNPVDAAGKPVPQAELEEAYAAARAAYKAAGAEDKLVLEGTK
jgi:dienelactone hydrolase